MARLLTAPEAAQDLNINIWRLYELVRKGVVPVVRFGRRSLRFDPEALQRLKAHGGDQSVGEKVPVADDG